PSRHLDCRAWPLPGPRVRHEGRPRAGLEPASPRVTAGCSNACDTSRTFFTCRTIRSHASPGRIDFVHDLHVIPIEERFPRPSVMGVVNVTPDSFSDGGVHLDPDVAAAAARRMVADGAAVVDVGGESTRPGSAGVSADEELRRVVPVLDRLGGELPLSIDT